MCVWGGGGGGGGNSNEIDFVDELKLEFGLAKTLIVASRC